MLNLNLDARKIIFLGAKGNLQQDIKQLLVQIEIAFNIFELKHPNCIAVLVFDQSFAYASYREGALNAFNINLNNKGKKLTLKDTYYPLKCTIQTLYTINAKGNKINKGVKTILQEKGYQPENVLNLKCKNKCFNPIAYLVLISNSPFCYLARILSTYKDFFEQKSAISIAIENRGHKCIFIPKFHCEVNAIKMY